MKNLFNNISELEKNRILEMHSGKKKVIKEGIGTTIFILTVVGIGYLVRKLKKFLDKFGAFIPSTGVITFMSAIKKIEKGEREGEVVVTKNGKYVVIDIIENGESFDSLTIDMYEDMIYSGKHPNSNNLIIPIEFPDDVSDDDYNKARQIEEDLVKEILEIVARYSEKK
jgi:hypothetical protein